MWVATTMGLAGAGLGLSMSLWVMRGGGTALPGCGPGGGCDAVLSSKWSAAAGVPVAAGAAGVYGLVLIGLLRTRTRVTWAMLLVCAAMLLGAAAWFTLLQWTVLQAWCPWCMATHGVGSLTAALLAWAAPVGRRRLLPEDPPDPKLLGPGEAVTFAAAGVLLVAGLATLQALAPAPGPQIIRFGGIVGRPADGPILGSPDAPHILVYLYDYTCPQCRELHGQLQQARDRYGDALAIVPMPAPLDVSCNPAAGVTEDRHRGACDLARLSLAVWWARPDLYESMHDWLMTGPQPPTVEAATEHARNLIGEDVLPRALADDWPDRQLARAVGLYDQTGAGVLPRLMAGTLLIAGRPSTAAELFTLLERELGLRPHEQRDH